MSAFGGAFGAPAAAVAPHNPNKDIEVTSPPGDGVSCLAFSPVSNLLVAGSWDNQVRCWDVQPSGQTVPKAATAHDQPVLCAAWSADGASVFSGGCDKAVKMWSLATGQATQVGAHDAPVRHAAFVKELNLLVTGSWDRTLRYWDARSPTAAHTQALPERVYALDVKHPLMVVGMANRRIQVFNLSNPQTPYKDVESPLKFQTRCVAAFPDTTGYLVGSIEGRVAVQHVEDALAAKNFTFKCHREGADIYAVNAIAFHPLYGTFVTAGADGAYNFWDKDSKQRLKAMQKANAPIPAGVFNRDGSIFAYAVSYDWSHGFSQHNPATARNHILLHPSQEAEVKNRARAKR